jgi:hypothetical protein
LERWVLWSWWWTFGFYKTKVSWTAFQGKFCVVQLE